jgi:HD-like signal output (HDOD) protein
VDIDKQELITHLKKLPPLSAPLQQVLSLLNDNQSDWSTISKVMLKDPVLTGRVLQIANSSFYGLHRQVKDVEVACAMLGSETLRSLIYTLILLSKFRHGKSDSLLDYDQLWRHCLRVACLAKKIARKMGQHPITAFTIGLFHCLDLIILDYFFSNELAERIETYYSENDTDKGTKLSEMINTDTWWLSATLLEHWQFPPTIVSVFQKEENSAVTHVRVAVVASSIILKDIDEDGKISESSNQTVNEIFQKNGIAVVDFHEALIESEKLFVEMSSLMFS